MNEIIEIKTVAGPLSGRIRPPGSKSITNRALLMAAIAKGESVLTGVLESDDTEVMLDSLRRLGVEVEFDRAAQRIRMRGCEGNFPNRKASLQIGNSGTTIRFLTAVLGMVGGNYHLDGIARMRERPIGPLVEALRSLGADVAALSPNQAPPVSIRPSACTGRHVKLGGNLSSQYLSGLLMAAPLTRQTMTFEIEGELVSKPYLRMTVEMMRSFGVTCHHGHDWKRFEVPGSQAYLGTSYQVEPDASAASYFLAAAAICGGTATVSGLNENSLQGDVKFVRVLEQMGCQVKSDLDSISVTGPALVGIDVDMVDISDTAQTVAVVAAFVRGSTQIRNIAHNRIKETDRIGCLANELRRLGVRVEEFSDGLQIHPDRLRGAELETYDDHRMAMSLALVGLRVPEVSIKNPGCVAKTYPNYFEDLKRFCETNRV